MRCVLPIDLPSDPPLVRETETDRGNNRKHVGVIKHTHTLTHEDGVQIP